MSEHQEIDTDEAAGTVAGEASDTGPGRSRRLDVVSLVAGIVFVSMAGAFALAGLDTLEEQVRIVWPTALLGIGLGMLLGTRYR